MIKIFPQSNSLELTEQIVHCDFAMSTYGSGKKMFTLGKLHKTKFANGEITVVLEESVRNETIVIVSQARSYEDMFELLETIDAAKRSSAREIIGVIPCLPHSRQERRENGVRTTISARLLADMLQVAGLDRLITMDVHTTAIEGFYKIPFDNIDAFEKLVQKISQCAIKNPTIVSPDFGGMKRAKHYANHLGCNLAFFSKERLKANEVAEMTLIGSVDGSDVVIVDDMIDTGGTILKALDLLKQNGAKNIYVFATHGIFSNGAIDKFATNHNTPYIYTTNTIPVDSKINSYVNFTTIDVSCEFHKALRKILN